MKYQILHGDNRETLKTIADNSIDAIVTDPPYGIDFLGKAWDANTGALETYQECLRVLKPGGHIVAFSAARTYHHLAVTLEAAGFEIRDQIMWIYSSGFPKSQDVGRSIQRTIGVEERKAHKSNLPRVGGGEDKTKAWDESAEQGQVVCTDPEAKKWEGWGTQLKPAHEPIALARKPMKLSIAKNCQAHGVGALNIDATRVPYAEDDTLEEWKQRYPDVANGTPITHANFNPEQRIKKDRPSAGKRTTSFHNATGGGETQSGGDGSGGWEANTTGRFPSNVLGDIPDYQKYFYCPKVSRAERHVGFDYAETNKEMCASIGVEYKDNETTLPGIGMVKDHGLRQEIEKIRGYSSAGNNHPTVKPIELMKYLIRLITPEGGTVLDPFNGSGSTGCAAVELGYEYIGCELDKNYVEIARKRIEAWYAETNPTTFNQLFEQE
jgi:DNA modification methylase